MAKHACRPRLRSASELDDLEQEHTALVRVVAWQVYSRLPRFASVELTDLLQAGYLGLMRARQSYRPDKEVQFPVYARFRIRGEILDMLRRLDSAPRSLRRWQRAIETGSRELGLQLQRVPTDEELSESLGIQIGIIRRNKQILWSSNMEAGTVGGRGEDPRTKPKEWAAAPDWMPDAIHERNESLQMLLECVGCLPPRTQKVILLYYRQNLTMKQIGALLRVNESRVSQIHKAALKSMGGRLKSAGIKSSLQFQK